MLIPLQRPHGRISAFLACVVVTSLFSSYGHGQAPETAPIERAVREQADRQKGDASFWLIIREKAALGPAAGIQNKKARKRFVYERATEVAARSQANLQRLLRARHASFQSCHS